MPDLNRVILLGRLTRDPSLRHTPGGTPVAEFGIAVNRTWSGPDGDRKEETCFVDIVVWARRAEVCHSSLRKGSPVFLEGRLHLDTWESQGGEKRSRLKVVANNVIFLNPAPRSSRGGGGRSDRQRKAERRPAEGPPAEGPPAERPPAEGPPAEAPPPEAPPEVAEDSGEADFPF